MSHRDSSSNDETTSAGEQVARVLQSCFDRRDNDTRLASGISTETHSRRSRLVEMASISSESLIVSSGASGRPQTE